jgi:hypothetical protein
MGDPYDGNGPEPEPDEPAEATPEDMSIEAAAQAGTAISEAAAAAAAAKKVAWESARDALRTAQAARPLEPAPTDETGATTASEVEPAQSKPEEVSKTEDGTGEAKSDEAQGAEPGSVDAKATESSEPPPEDASAPEAAADVGAAVAQAAAAAAAESSPEVASSDGAPNAPSEGKAPSEDNKAQSEDKPSEDGASAKNGAPSSDKAPTEPNDLLATASPSELAELLDDSRRPTDAAADADAGPGDFVDKGGDGPFSKRATRFGEVAVGWKPDYDAWQFSGSESDSGFAGVMGSEDAANESAAHAAARTAADRAGAEAERLGAERAAAHAKLANVGETLPEGHPRRLELARQEARVAHQHEAALREKERTEIVLSAFDQESVSIVHRMAGLRAARAERLAEAAEVAKATHGAGSFSLSSPSTFFRCASFHLFFSFLFPETLGFRSFLCVQYFVVDAWARAIVCAFSNAGANIALRSGRL